MATPVGSMFLALALDVEPTVGDPLIVGGSMLLIDEGGKT